MFAVARIWNVACKGLHIWIYSAIHMIFACNMNMYLIEAMQSRQTVLAFRCAIWMRVQFTLQLLSQQVIWSAATAHGSPLLDWLRNKSGEIRD